jgi:hypothetical protein
MREPVAETSTYTGQHNRQTSMPRAGFEPRPQQPSSRRPTPYTARPLGSAKQIHYWINNKMHVGGISCELTKAFDCVNNELLLKN